MFDLQVRPKDNRSMLTHNVRRQEPKTAKQKLTRTGASILALSLGFSASVVASPTLKHEAGVETSAPAKPKHRWFQIGKASWYGGSFQGKKTADGERYDMNALTCAHRTLPLGSWIRVTNLRNKRSAFVRVNDRGPGPMDRVIDLSYAAAHSIGIAGVAKVKIEEVTPNDPGLMEALVNQLPVSPNSAGQAVLSR
jgi:rare lipoprotein A